MTGVVIAILIAGILIAGAIYASRVKAGGGEGSLLMQQQMDGLREQLGQSLADSSREVRESLAATQQLVNTQLDGLRGQMQSSFEASSRTVTEVKQGLTKVEASSEKVFNLAKNISALEDILKAPKLRGGLGELFLEDLLRQILPGSHYETQHRFTTGEMVDAVVHLSGKMVPIDAKFPLENFQKMLATTDEEDKKKHRKQLTSDIKKHVKSISDKYIRTDEGTFDFAMMYIPAENVYYETIILDDHMGEDKSISGYALARKVIPVSPNSFYAYLKAIVLGLRGLHIEESAQEVLATLGALRKDLGRFEGDFDRLGTHLDHAGKSYHSARDRLQKFTTKLEGAETATGLPAPDKKQIAAEEDTR